jgi:uncharacterized membrane protein YphA (DoxX/SURF4 family)
MITLPRLSSTTDTGRLAARSPLARLAGIVTWPFTHRYASPIWLALRLYAAWIWFQFGMNKLQAGWLTGDPIGGIFKHVAGGELPVPWEPFRGLAAWMLEAGLTPHISHAMPFLELAVALAFASGVLVVPAAVGGILLLINIQLSGTGSLAFDLRMIVIHALLVLAFRVVGAIGFERLALRILAAAKNVVRPARPAPALQPAPVAVRAQRRRR